MKPMRNSIRATYDSRETGLRYHVTTRVGVRTIEFQKRVTDPFVSHRVTIGWPDLLRGLLRGCLTVDVMVDGDPDVVNDVLELDDNTLVPNSTRKAAFHSHRDGRDHRRVLGGDQPRDQRGHAGGPAAGHAPVGLRPHP